MSRIKNGTPTLLCVEYPDATHFRGDYVYLAAGQRGNKVGEGHDLILDRQGWISGESRVFGAIRRMA